MSKTKTIYDHRYRAVVSELTKERIRLNISQEELAKIVNVNQSDISKIEKFEKRLDVLEFSLILRALRIQENNHLKNVALKFIGLTEE